MAKVHVSEDGRIRPCKAQSPATCTAKGIDDEKALHFDTELQAKKYVESLYDKKIGTFNTFDASIVQKKLNTDYVSLNDKIEEMEYDDIVNFSNANINNFNALNEVIEFRSDEIYKKSNGLENYNPNVNKNTNSNEIFKEMKRDLREYKDKTSEIAEIYSQSKFFKPKYFNKDLDTVGVANYMGSFKPGSVELIDAKFNTIDGDEINILAQRDFGEKTLLNTIQYKGLEKSKISKENNMAISPTSRIKSGAIYRDSIWKKRIKDEYAKTNKNIVLISNDSYYSNKDKNWQMVKFDGIVVNTKNRQPEGLIEIKTNVNNEQWADGVPIGAKAEALYYLNSTDLNYVDLIVQSNDYRTNIFRVNKNESLKEGSTIEDYLKNSVEPWFNNIRNIRN